MQASRLGAGLTLTAVLFAGAAVPQEQPEGGRTLTLRFGVTARVDDNFPLATPRPGTSAFLANTFGLDFASRTRTESLGAGISGLWRLGRLRGTATDTGLDEPSAYLSYSRTSANAAFALNADYREQQVSFLTTGEEIGEDFDPRDIVSGQGTLARTNLRSTLDLGTRGPLGFTLEVARSDRDYRDTTSPELFDTTNDSAEANLRLRLTPTLTGKVMAALYHYRAEDAPRTDRRTRRLGLALEGEISPVLSFGATLAHNRIDTEETIGAIRSSRVDDGFSGNLTLTRKLPAGSAGIEIDNSFSTRGNRTTLRLQRSFDLPRGSLVVSLGATHQENIPGAFTVGALDYTLQGTDDSFAFNLSRQVQTSSIEDVVEVTSLRASYTRRINDLSRIGLAASWVDSRAVGTAPTISDRSSANLRLSYSRELARGWMLTGALEHRRLDLAGSGSAHSNAALLSLDKRFSLWR